MTSHCSPRPERPGPAAGHASSSRQDLSPRRKAAHDAHEMNILHFIPSIDPATGGPVEGLKQRSAIYHSGGHTVEVASLDAPDFVAVTPFPAPVIALGPGRGTYGYSARVLPWLAANAPRFDLVLI